jgi:putative transcriptional regulator
MQKTSNDSYLTGQLLIAMPSMKDPRFHHSVIFICGHDENGAMGLLINKTLDEVRLSHILEQLKMPEPEQGFDLPVHFGGPVEMGRGFALHSTDFMLKDSVKIGPDIALTANTEILQTFAYHKAPKKRFLALGYAGWSSGQLEEEIKENSWLQMETDPALIFARTPKDLWKKALKKMGIDPAMLPYEAGHA